MRTSTTRAHCVLDALLVRVLHQLLNRGLLLVIAKQAQPLTPHFAVRVLLAAPLQLPIQVAVLNFVLRVEEAIIDCRWTHLT